MAVWALVAMTGCSGSASDAGGPDTTAPARSTSTTSPGAPSSTTTLPRPTTTLSCDAELAASVGEVAGITDARATESAGYCTIGATDGTGAKVVLNLNTAAASASSWKSLAASTGAELEARKGLGDAAVAGIDPAAPSSALALVWVEGTGALMASYDAPPLTEATAADVDHLLEIAGQVIGDL